MDPWASPWAEQPPAAPEPLEALTTASILAPVPPADDPWSEPAAPAASDAPQKDPGEIGSMDAWRTHSPPPAPREPSPSVLSGGDAWSAAAPEPKTDVLSGDAWSAGAPEPGPSALGDDGWAAAAAPPSPPPPVSALDSMPSVLEDPWSGGVVVLPTGDSVSSEIERQRSAIEAQHRGEDPESEKQEPAAETQAEANAEAQAEVPGEPVAERSCAFEKRHYPSPSVR